MSSRILVVEDDPATRSALEEMFTQYDFHVSSVAAGEEAIAACRRLQPDLVLLDLGLPDADGFDVCRAIRAMSNVPIIMVSGRPAMTDAVAGLELGADCYVQKPFNAAELLARAKSFVVRYRAGGYAPATENVVEAGEVRLEIMTHRAWVRGRQVHLTPKEFELLQVLMRQPGTVLRSADLLQSIWGYDSSIRTRTLDVHVARLRAKIERDTSRPQLIITVPGVGYYFNAAHHEHTP